MDKEGFLDAIRKQYADEIHEIYLECEHDDGRRVDYAKLNSELKRIRAHARVEGLSDKEFDDLVKSTLPGSQDKLELNKKAA